MIMEIEVSINPSQQQPLREEPKVKKQYVGEWGLTPTALKRWGTDPINET